MADASHDWLSALPAPDTETLLERVAQGDRPAFALLYDRLASAVYGISLRVVADPSLAEEIVRDALLVVWSTAALFDRARGSARGWILSIAHRRAVEAVRTEHGPRARAGVAAASAGRRVADVAEAVSDGPDRHELAGPVRSALGTLTDLQRAAVELAYFSGLTHTEVADTLAVPPGAIKARIHDGMLRLTAELNRRGPSPAS